MIFFALNIAIIFAGGIGSRCEYSALPKQFIEIDGEPIIVKTIRIFQCHSQIDKIYVSVVRSHIDLMRELVERYQLTKIAGIVEGGETSQDSIFNALNLAKQENHEDSIVLIHDGVRPLLDPEVITKNIECVEEKGNAITCTPCTETILIATNENKTEKITQRNRSFLARAPQSFRLKDIYDAHLKIRSMPDRYTGIVDSCTLLHTLGIQTNIVIGNNNNIKITTKEDLKLLK